MSRKCPTCGTVYEDNISFCGEDGTINIQVLPPEEADPRLGEKLGHYVVVARVADGAMGRVFEGRHIDTKARVAVKVLHDDVAKDAIAVERFKREADTAKELAHKHVVHVIDFGQTNDKSYFLTMEFLEGEELGHALRRDGAIAVSRAVRVMSQMASALDHAHSFGVIHRDLKPDNVFLCRTPEGDMVRVLDFGSVKLQMETGPKLTAFGTTLGSPYYMSPEQAMGKADVDQRTDVFACAAILYEMLVGKVAFDAPNVAMILMRIMNEQPPAPSALGLGLPVALDDVIEKGLRKDKARRFASVTELADAFVAALGLEGNAADWAYRPAAEIESALAKAKPPTPKPFGAESIPPPAKGKPQSVPAKASSSAPPASQNSFGPQDPTSLYVPKRSKMGLYAGIAIAVVVVGAIAFFATR